jgi:hypothetical protein
VFNHNHHHHHNQNLFHSIRFHRTYIYNRYHSR